MKKQVSAIAIIFVFLSLALLGFQAVKADSNSSIQFSGGVTIYCPLNETYNSNYLTLSLNASLGAGIHTSLNYSIDGQASQGPIPLVYSDAGFPFYNGAGTVALPELSAGSHTLTIYEQSIIPDYHGANPPGAPFKQASSNSSDWIATWVDTVYFSINSSWTPLPTQQPTLEPIPTPNNTQENFTPIIIIAGLVVLAVVVGLLVYFKKIKK
jgi:hypothetical protein